MDLQMPEMGCYPATAKIRSEEGFKELPMVAMTAHATIEERQRCLAAGMNDHISKPIDPGMLFETVGRFYKPAVSIASAAVSASSPPQQPKQESPDHSPSAGNGPGATASRGTSAGADELPTIEGLDARDGLTRVAGNRKLYLK